MDSRFRIDMSGLDSRAGGNDEKVGRLDSRLRGKDGEFCVAIAPFFVTPAQAGA